MKSIARLFSELRSDLLPYAIAFILLSVSTSLFLLVPPQVGQLLASVSRNTGKFPMSIALGIGAILTAQSFMMSAYSYIVNITAERIGNRFRARFFDNLLHLDLNSLGQRSLGEIASQFSSDIAVVQAGMSDTLINFLRHVLVTGGAAVAMAVVGPSLAAVTLASVLTVAAIIIGFTHFASKSMLAAQKARAGSVALLVESAASAYVIKAYRRERWFNQLFGDRLAGVLAQVKRQTRLLALINPVTVIVLAGALLLILQYGGHQLDTGVLRPEDLISFLTYALVLVTSVSQLGITYAQLKQSALVLDQNSVFLGAARDNEAACWSEADAIPSRTAPISFKVSGATLRINGHSILKDISCDMPGGGITMIAGASGAGKSSLVAILAGIVSPSAGEVTMSAGAPLDPREIAIVPQNPFLFEGSVNENIRFGRDWISTEDTRIAASSAHALEFVRALPDGFEHFVQEGGRNLSRGQQQRLALARALAGKPKVLILDEATASLDAASELAVKRAIVGLKGKITIIIVAHHGELRSLADWVIVLDKGEKVYEGPPDTASDQAPNLATPAHQLIGPL